MRSVLFSGLFWAFAMVWSNAAMAQADTDRPEIICNSGQFALCTSAPCVPDPNDPSRTICSCIITQGPSFGLDTDCDARPPQHVGDSPFQQIISVFSFVEAASKPLMTCPQGEATWSDCLDQPCTVDPLNPLKATCSCKVVTPEMAEDPNGGYNEDFVTYGGNCNTSTCSGAVWSAATVSSFQVGSAALMHAMGLDTNPTNYCPGQFHADLSKR